MAVMAHPLGVLGKDLLYRFPQKGCARAVRAYILAGLRGPPQWDPMRHHHPISQPFSLIREPNALPIFFSSLSYRLRRLSPRRVHVTDIM